MLNGPPHRTFAAYPLHAQQFRQHAVTAYRCDVRISLVTCQYRKHHRPENVLLRRSVGAPVVQWAILNPTLPEPVRLQKFEEVSNRTEAGHVRIRIPANENLAAEGVNGPRSALY